MPLADVIQRMNDLQFIFPVQRLFHQCGGWGNGTQTVAGKVGAIRSIDTEHGVHLLVMGKKERCP
jgi:hypothetical protein